MSFRNCIEDAKAEGVLTDDQAKYATDLFDNLEAEYKGKMNTAAAQAQAGADTFDALRKKTMQRKRQKAMQLRTWNEIKTNIENYKDWRGNPNQKSAAIALFAQDRPAGFASVAQREEAIKGFAFGEMNRVIGTFNRNLFGVVRQKAKLDNLVRETFGEATGDASAKELAQGWSAAAEMLRKRFNRAGGAISKLENWGMAQTHEASEITKAGFDAWREFIVRRLDRSKMLDAQTGLPFDDATFDRLIANAYKTITTNGVNKLKPSGVGAGKSLANRNQDHRFLIFENATGWIEYQKKFGKANPFDAMITHVSNMSRDIALMEILGPNPASTVTFLKQTLVKNAEGDEAATKAIQGADSQIDNYYSAVTGKNNEPVNAFWAHTFAGIRQVLQSAQLGAASISAITDVNFQRMARQFNGLPVANTLTSYLKMLSPLDAKEKGELAIRLGLIAEGWTSLASGQMRYVGDISGPEVTRRVSDFVMKASLLSPMTAAGRWAFGMETFGFLASNSKRTFSELKAENPKFTAMLERYQVDESAWNVIRTTTPYDHKGAKFLRPADIMARNDVGPLEAESIATRLLEMVNTETNFSTPSTGVVSRTMLTGGTRPGTAVGELTRSFAMYKGFGVSLINSHGMRMAEQPTALGKGTYLADLIISATLMGALALQLKEMSKGRDPRPMDDETGEFWAAAFLQGGGLGVYGDFLFSDLNRFDRGLGETIAGPVVGFANDVKNLTIGNLVEAIAGDDTKAASELIKFGERYTPGSSIWYARLGLERIIWDRLQMMSDPKAMQKMRREETKYRREYGQKYWWGPGDIEPTRQPDLSNANLSNLLNIGK